MSKLNDESITIYEALQNIQSGKYVMPAFQRQFVWDMERIEKLWDSILLGYPVATFLFWNINENNVSKDTYFCDFLKSVVFDSRKQPDSTNYELITVNDFNVTNTAVLDGQQRLTSLYLSLFGNITLRPKSARKVSGEKICVKLLVELNKHKIDVDEEEYNSKKFDISFSDKIGKLSPTQFEIRKILDPEFQDDDSENKDERRKKAIEETIKYVPADSKDYARNILNNLYKKVYVDKLIRYTEILDMNQDDALEMFVRFNSGGKSLSKSQITMSIFEAYWPSAKSEFGKALSGSFDGFDSEFIIRTALLLYGDVVKSNINKKISDQLKNDWKDFVKALNNLDALLKDLQIDISRFKNGWNVLLPIIYVIYYNPDYLEFKDAIQSYLVRAILFTYFQSGTTGKLQQMKNNINAYDMTISIDMLEQMNELRVTDAKLDDVVNTEKGSRVAGEVLYYISKDWINTKLYKYEPDHLHPHERFDEAKPTGVDAADWKRWRANRNRVPNLWLLEGRSNGGKNAMRLIDYYNDMNEDQQKTFLSQAMIPEGTSLELKDFDTLYSIRKENILAKIKDLVGYAGK